MTEIKHPRFLIAQREVAKAAFRFAVNEYGKGLIGILTADEYIANWEPDLSDEELTKRLQQETFGVIGGLDMPDFEKYQAFHLFNAVSTRKATGLPDLAEYETFLAVNTADFAELIKK